MNQQNFLNDFSIQSLKVCVSQSVNLKVCVSQSVNLKVCVFFFASLKLLVQYFRQSVLLLQSFEFRWNNQTDFSFSLSRNFGYQFVRIICLQKIVHQT